MLNDQTQQLSDEELLAFLRGVNTGALRLRRLIENFIQLVEMETGDAQKTYDLRKAPITEIGGTVRSGAAGGLQHHPFHAALQRRGRSRGCRRSSAMSLYLKMALAQLIDNAVKFSAAGSADHGRRAARRRRDSVCGCATAGAGLTRRTGAHLGNVLPDRPRDLRRSGHRVRAGDCATTSPRCTGVAPKSKAAHRRAARSRCASR